MTSNSPLGSGHAGFLTANEARNSRENLSLIHIFMWMCEDNIVEVPFDKEHLLERILSPDNLNQAYKAVVRNQGCGGIDKMSCEELLRCV